MTTTTSTPRRAVGRLRPGVISRRCSREDSRSGCIGSPSTVESMRHSWIGSSSDSSLRSHTSSQCWNPRHPRFSAHRPGTHQTRDISHERLELPPPLPRPPRHAGRGHRLLRYTNPLYPGNGHRADHDPIGGIGIWSAIDTGTAWQRDGLYSKLGIDSGTGWMMEVLCLMDRLIILVAPEQDLRRGIVIL